MSKVVDRIIGGVIFSPSVQITSGAPTSASFAMTGVVTNPGGSVSGLTVTITQSGSASGSWTATTASDGTWSKAITGAANGDLFTASFAAPVSAKVTSAIVVAVFTALSAQFEASTDVASYSGILTTSASSVGACAFWFRAGTSEGTASNLETMASSYETIFGSGSSAGPRALSIQKDGVRRIHVTLKNTAQTQTFSFASTSGLFYSNDQKLHHVAISWNVSTASPTAQIFIDGVADTVTTITTPTAGFTVDHSTENYWTVGGQAATVANPVSGLLSEFMYFPGVAINWATSISKLFSAGAAVDPGSDGSLVTGSKPLVYFSTRPGDAPAAFVTNRGSGASFTGTGTPKKRQRGYFAWGDSFRGGSLASTSSRAALPLVARSMSSPYALRGRSFPGLGILNVMGVNTSGTSLMETSGSATTITAASWASNIATFVFGSDLRTTLNIGGYVKVSGVTPADYNGTWKVTSITSTSITVSLPSGTSIIAGSAFGSFLLAYPGFYDQIIADAVNFEGIISIQGGTNDQNAGPAYTSSSTSILRTRLLNAVTTFNNNVGPGKLIDTTKYLWIGMTKGDPTTMASSAATTAYGTSGTSYQLDIDGTNAWLASQFGTKFVDLNAYLSNTTNANAIITSYYASNASPPGGGTAITSASYASSQATFTVPGDLSTLGFTLVTVSGMTPTQYNGTWQVTSAVYSAGTTTIACTAYWSASPPGAGTVMGSLGPVALTAADAVDISNGVVPRSFRSLTDASQGVGVHLNDLGHWGWYMVEKAAWTAQGVT